MREQEDIEMSGEAEDRWSNPAGKLASYRGPAFRKAYLACFLEQGRRFEAEGDLRSAQYCLDKLAVGLEQDEPVPKSEVAPDRAFPLDALRSYWRQRRLRGTEAVLARHGRRLTPLEREAYRGKLEKLSGASVAEPKLEDADAVLLSLRSRLYQRILRSQKTALAGGGKRAVLPVRSAPSRDLHRFIGPYNNRNNLESLLAEVEKADPLWVGEFLSLYRRLFSLGEMFAGAERPGKKDAGRI